MLDFFSIFKKEKKVNKLLLVFALLFFISLGCSSTQSKSFEHRNYQPFFDYKFNPIDDTHEYNIIGPFFTYINSSKNSEVDLRPFFSRRFEKESETVDMEYVYPLGIYKRKPKSTSNKLIPIFSSKLEENENRTKENVGAFPFFYGKTSNGDSYGGFFPFYGTMKERFGKDNISFFLWPIYSESTVEKTSKKSFLWPFVTVIKGESEQGFKLWPLFGNHKKENEFNKHYFLWPLIFYEEKDLNTNSENYYQAFLPFWAKHSYRDASSKSILWPFFNLVRDDYSNFRLIDFPWPFLQWSKGDDRSSFSFFPFFGYKKGLEKNSRFFLWPLYSFKEESKEGYQKQSHKFLILSKTEKEIIKKEEKFSSLIWPLFNYEKKSSHETSFDFPYLIPITSVGYKKIIAPILTLYYYKKKTTGDEESRLLWGVYSYDKNKSGVFRSLSLFLSYKGKTDGDQSVSFLSGLLEIGKEKGEKYFKLFYLKFPYGGPQTG